MNLIHRNQLEAQHRGHFFSAGAKRFFRSRIAEYGYQGPGGTYFVTSEQFDDRSPRLYSVRRMADGHIETVGEFQGYASRNGAHKAAKRLAEGGAS